MELLEREEALAALAEAHGAAARGEGGVAIVTGEAGIGKSALVARFLGELDAEGRVLAGTCDDLAIPRPLGPFRDLVGAVSAGLGRALSGGAPPHEVQALLVEELERPPRPTALVLEDVHWADQATLDAITVLGRRIGSLPALLVLTCRTGEVAPDHPLRVALGAIRPPSARTLELGPLSRGAVASLAGDAAEEVYAATRGNPFFVTELLASRTSAELPPSVSNAVLGRASRLEPASRRLLELVSVVPSRVPTSLLDAVLPEWPEAAVEPERRALLEVGAGQVRFRHELARQAVRSSLPISARRTLHRQILDALLASGGDLSDIVHHAEAAGARDVVAEHALPAARRAAALQSNREALSHYRRASDFLDRLPAPEQAVMLEELATTAWATGRLEEAFPALRRAIAIHRELDDPAALGRSTRVLAVCHWSAGDGDAARAAEREALAVLEPVGDSVELARLYGTLSRRALLEEDFDGSREWGERALALATSLGHERSRVHALVDLGSLALYLDPAETAPLLAAHEAAHAAGEPHEASVALVNLAYMQMAWGQARTALPSVERALAYAREHEVHPLASYASRTLAWLRLRAGEWDEAERLVGEDVVGGAYGLLGDTVLAELAVRRGDDDAVARLRELAAKAERAGELQRLYPVLELETELALTGGEPVPAERFAPALERIRGRSGPPGWAATHIAAAAALAGLDVELAVPPGGPYGALCRRDWRGAAEAFGEEGWTYDRALALSLLDDEASLAEALELARGLGAAPLARRAAERLRELGLRVPQGPRRKTRVNPAGLTPRQLEVLALLAEGLTNAELAERLVISERTAEHHVSAVLTKLGAATRREAARRATELRLLGPG